MNRGTSTAIFFERINENEKTPLVRRDTYRSIELTLESKSHRLPSFDILRLKNTSNM